MKLMFFLFQFLHKNQLESPYYVLIVDEVTMNMAEYGCRLSQQPANVNFKPIIRGLKSDIFTGTKCKIRFIC